MRCRPKPMRVSVGAARRCASRLRSRTTACSPSSMPARRSGISRNTTWFFETFLLVPFVQGYRRFHPSFEYLFNSYYNGRWAAVSRARRRGNLSRPTVAEVLAYRRHVDAAMERLLVAEDAEVQGRAELGLHHEQQHQELLVTDFKVTLGSNPVEAGVCRSDWIRLGRATTRVAPTVSALRRGAGGSGDGCRCRILLRQRKPGASRLAGAVCAGESSGYERGIFGVHRGRRLCGAVALAVRRLGLGAGTRHRRADVLAFRRGRLAGIPAGRRERDRAAPAGDPFELL